jgi:DNA polymerase (family 10)
VETGTCLEINGQPDRLDLRDAHARLAVELGVRIVLSSDAHSAAAVRYLDLAVTQARRAWLRAADVVNARPWPEVQELMRR